MAMDAMNRLSAKSQETFPVIPAVTPSSRLLPGFERCALCKVPIRGDASTLVLCTKCVEFLDNSNELSKVLAQCCDCGIMLNGIHRGEKPFTAGGQPDLSVGNSHGICASCAASKMVAHRAAGRQRRECRQQ